MSFWTKQAGVKPQFIQPVKPTQNGIVESFNGEGCEYRLGVNSFASLEGARSMIDHWRSRYNYVRRWVSRLLSCRSFTGTTWRLRRI